MSRSRLPILLAGLLIVSSFNQAAYSQQSTSSNDHLWKPKTRSVSVFKNGFAFFTQSGKVKLNDGWCYASELPPAAFGTLAVYSTKTNQVVDIVGSGNGEVVDFETTHTTIDNAAKIKTLSAWTGFRIRLETVKFENRRELDGKLLEIIGGYAILEKDQQTFAVKIDEIARIQLFDMPLKVHVVEEGNGEAEKAATAETELEMAYLRSGMLWIPEYTLRLLDDENAELTLRGTLINEAEDLIDCDVNFVVGVPNFAHSNLMAPAVAGRVLRAVGTSILQSSIPSQFGNQMMNRAAIFNNSRVDLGSQIESGAQPATPQDFVELLGNLPQMDSAGSNDFNVYRKENLTVRVGERAIVTLMTKKIKYGHRYRWNTNDSIEHLLTMKNNSTTPWTTGPCLTLSESQPLSEDSLRYTPPGAVGEIKVTTAINIASEITERESDRDLKSHEVGNGQYLDRVVVSGTIRVKSFEDKPIELIVSQPILGRPLEASGTGKIKTDAEKLRLVERNGSIGWTVNLVPGEEQTLSFTYERYVPSN